MQEFSEISLEPTKNFIRDNKFKNDINSIRQARRLIMTSDIKKIYTLIAQIATLHHHLLIYFMHEQELDFTIP